MKKLPYEITLDGQGDWSDEGNWRVSVPDHFTRIYPAQHGWRETLHEALDKALDDPEVRHIEIYKTQTQYVGDNK